ncbi:MAG TPA: hypothetical protein VNO26_11960 [Candidatus Limnocylindria bacterium]|nr:hypothetical protein [Candidatus Limnocylindria bacterium]
MALLTHPEFRAAVEVLCEHFTLPRLRDKLASVGAFTSRRGLNSPAELAERLFKLSGGLRLQGRATYGFSLMWGEMLSARLGEEGEKKLEELADRVNACLDEHEALIPGKEAELEAALAEYHRALAAAVGERAARLDMTLKAVPDVVEHVRRLGAAPS